MRPIDLVGSSRVAAHRAGHVAAALFDLDLHVELAALRQVRDHVVGVDDLDVVRGLDVGGGDAPAFAVLAQDRVTSSRLWSLNTTPLRFRQDVDHVFLHAVDRRVLVQNAGDRDLGGRIAHHGRQQHAAQRVAERVAIAALERLEGDLGAVGAKLLDVDGLGFQQVGLHAGLPLNTPGSLHR
jgi:hypothetical protein